MSSPLSFLRSSSDCMFRPHRRCSRYLKVRRRFAEGSFDRVPSARRISSTAVALECEGREGMRDEYDGRNDFRQRRDDREDRDLNSVYPKPRPKADPKPLVDYLKRLFPPLEFPDRVATQMLTHISAREAWAGHNSRLGFIGRRVMQTYLLLFLREASEKLARTTNPRVDPNRTFDFDKIAYKALFTYLLGEYVGNEWQLSQIMLWKPAASSNDPFSRTEDRVIRKSPGLYKVQGATVEGIMGGVFHQFGGTVAHRVFHTRLLPHILCPGTPHGLHDAFHPAALEILDRMGGPDSLLNAPIRSASGNSSYPKREAVSSADRSEERIIHLPQERHDLPRKRLVL